MFGCESDMSIAFLVLVCTFIIKDAKVLGAIIFEVTLHSLSYIFIAEVFFILLLILSLYENVPGWQAVLEYGWPVCQRRVEVRAKLL